MFNDSQGQISIFMQGPRSNRGVQRMCTMVSNGRNTLMVPEGCRVHTGAADQVGRQLKSSTAIDFGAIFDDCTFTGCRNCWNWRCWVFTMTVKILTTVFWLQEFLFPQIHIPCHEQDKMCCLCYGLVIQSFFLFCWLQGIEGSMVSDILCLVCCGYCVICQEAQEIE